MRLAAAEQSIGGVAGALLISACSDMHALPVPSVLCAANLPDSHWLYIQVFVRSSLTAFRGHTQQWLEKANHWPKGARW
jgi:hypothetical protein